MSYSGNTHVYFVQAYLHLQKENLIPLFLHSAIKSGQDLHLSKSVLRSEEMLIRKSACWSFTFLEAVATIGADKAIIIASRNCLV